ncbi:MAG: beta-ketoacyl-ACP synthase 3 [Christensenellaceae bacterium]|nr:beta-ketoacyl-ACP synthase 3 [Christensenellaceae bacterium]
MFAPVEIAGVASCVPARVVTNFELETMVDTSDEWISKRTGIKKRRIAVEETAVGMAAQAAAEALAMSGVGKDDIGLIVACTISGDNLTPAMASSVQKALDIPRCAAMDISAGCTGFVYALVTAISLMDTLGADSALVVASETMSKYVDWTDRSTCVLFGDGAGAVVLRRSEEPHMHYPILNAVPDTDAAIVIKKEARTTPFGPPVDGRMEYIRMNGSEVFTYAVEVMEDTLRRLHKMCGEKPYTKIIPHQANEKIIDYVMRTMRLDREQFFINISEYANTSSATIPIAMADAYRTGWLRQGDRVALVGFGSGLTSGGVVIDWTIPNKKEK